MSDKQSAADQFMQNQEEGGKTEDESSFISCEKDQVSSFKLVKLPTLETVNPDVEESKAVS